VTEKHRKTDTVLILDDEEMVRDLLGSMFRRLGYEPHFAKNGEEAVLLYTHSCANNAPFDYVMLDLTLPGELSGEEAVKRLRQINPQVKAIACSGYSWTPVMTNCQSYGFTGALAKPFRLRQLQKLLGELSEKQSNEMQWENK
jgi:CheY-like chemotaxis protein